MRISSSGNIGIGTKRQRSWYIVRDPAYIVDQGWVAVVSLDSSVESWIESQARSSWRRLSHQYAADVEVYGLSAQLYLMFLLEFGS